MKVELMSHAELEAALKDCVSSDHRARIEDEIHAREGEARSRLTAQHPTLFPDEGAPE